MQTGFIRSYDAERGFGFIQPAGGGGHQFFHCTQWQERHVEPQEGQEVTFEIANNSRTGKLQAVNVRVVGWTRRDAEAGECEPR